MHLRVAVVYIFYAHYAKCTKRLIYSKGIVMVYGLYQGEYQRHIAYVNSKGRLPYIWELVLAEK
jgi:hypothetical protein